MLVDVFITTFNRPGLLHESLKSFFKNTDRALYRLTVVQDGENDDVTEVIRSFSKSNEIDHVLWHKYNLGLGPSINQALAHINSLNTYYESFSNQYICYCQDDLLYTDKWLESLVKFHDLFSSQHKLGFASGVECVEHEVRQKLPNGMLLKDWIRAANMFSTTDYWMSMWPIPEKDPETGRLRARPHAGMGSGVDWWFSRNHENSVCKTVRTNTVNPGHVKHMGYKESTWLNRALPESESDKTAIEHEKSKRLLKDLT